jgi:PhnB protein
MHVQPYLFFEGRCQEAIDFYCSALGAEVRMLLRFRDGPGQAAQGGDKVMHACLQIGETEMFMSDGTCKGSPVFHGFSLSLAAADDTAARRLFAALSEGGVVTMPMMTTFFASSFGMVTDRFGVPWMVAVRGTERT